MVELGKRESTPTVKRWYVISLQVIQESSTSHHACDRSELPGSSYHTSPFACFATVELCFASSHDAEPQQLVDPTFSRSCEPDMLA